ncbi:innexin unc-9 isoform X1 [Octopus sinensis]|uniref:Innexin n=1 Tax=Octopus sinensis TaxID=2607531 RepID=A0A7E6EHE2_9MOLL|nr:innexin unc-9 isoform X1 [Octopus sinensis]
MGSDEEIGSILGGFMSWSRLRGSTNDDWGDRLNHLWTVFLLVLFAIVVTTTQYVGDPIHCWAPAEFPGHYVEYVKSYCWISNTYYISMNDIIPTDITARSDAEITYYQWTPLILLFMAFLFKFPNIIWRLLSSVSGVNLERVVDLAEQTQLGSPEDRQKTIEHIAFYMDRWLETYREYKMNYVVRMRQKMTKVCCLMCSKREGTFLVGFYVCVKALYAANVIGQFFLLNAFMSNQFSVYGYEVLEMVRNKVPWKESVRFPRVTLCDFEIRQLQNIQRFTVQCVLPVNLFNEKIFIFLWFWLVFISIVTCGNLLLWIYRTIFRQSHVNYIAKYLKSSEDIFTSEDKKLVHRFTTDYLRDDGFFVLRLVSKNSTDLVLVDLVKELWHLYKNKSGRKAGSPDLNNTYKDTLDKDDISKDPSKQPLKS